MVAELRERVKNDLQMISSLLFLEARRAEDPRALNGFRACMTRVRVLAMAHEHGERSAPSRVRLDAYLRAITTGLMVTHGDHDGRVRVAEALPPSVVSLEVAVACGLVTSELVTNALFHAFPGGRAGTVRVAVELGVDGEHALTVEDDGVGQTGGRRGLGLLLCERLAAQLGATLESSQGPQGIGTRSAIRFRP